MEWQKWRKILFVCSVISAVEGFVMLVFSLYMLIKYIGVVPVNDIYPENRGWCIALALYMLIPAVFLVSIGLKGLENYDHPVNWFTDMLGGGVMVCFQVFPLREFPSDALPSGFFISSCLLVSMIISMSRMERKKSVPKDKPHIYSHKQ